MTGQYLPDINVWVALSMPAHTYHATVVQWMERHPSPSLHFCRYTQQGLLRLSTTSAVTALFGQAPLTNRGALRRLDAWLEDPRIHFAQEPDHLFSQWSAFADVNTASPKLWMDAYLAAFAMAGGFRLVTTDKGFKQFKGLNALVLV